MINRKNKIKRDALVDSALNYFDSLNDKPSVHEKNVKVRIKNKDGKECEIKISEFDVPFLVSTAVTSINDLVDTKVGEIEFTREKLKSIEIIFD